MTASQLSATALRSAGAAVLTAAGIDCAASDSTWLLAHVLGVDPGKLLLVDHVAAAERAAFDALISRRAQRIPLQHLTAQSVFAEVELEVGPGVFIPRPETELLAQWATTFLRARPTGAPLRVVDACSGSGALALAIATAVPAAAVIAVERSPEALAYLRRNVAAQPASVARRIQVRAGDVTDPRIWAAIGECDLIVSNPPYVPAAAPVSPEVRCDPAIAVFSGESGMDLIVELVPQIAAALVPGGATAIEHDDTTAAQTAAVLADAGVFADVTNHRDLAGRPRYVTATRADVPAVQGWNS
ncbi:MAG: peptide chain release factor N(5)-glutamine methyltransferase [Gordonia sp. (in: high G+C Gram-positive bacteria)]|uniref:peptide chain release factor N(5)-glutamine methyltransferase n=1 Tax=Gordonia sp. (in: high G+C Gram-positive bacteria) TaxID=84139 RepID=UPI003BB4A22F